MEKKEPKRLPEEEEKLMDQFIASRTREELQELLEILEKDKKKKTDV